jgi:urease accessory protein
MCMGATMATKRRRHPEALASEASEPRRTSAPPSFEAGLRAAPQDDGHNGLHRALYRLLAWLSPAYPVGAFAYSSGIEWAVQAGDITDARSLQRWIESLLREGSGFCDAVLFAHVYRAVESDDRAALREIAELAAALTPSKERHLETTTQGNAFVEATQKVWPCGALEMLKSVWDGLFAYPVAVAVSVAGYSVPIEPALAAFLQALVANWVSAGVRLIPLGHIDGLRVVARLEADVAETAARALNTPLEDLGSAVFRADLASMRHETQYTRLFRS